MHSLRASIYLRCMAYHSLDYAFLSQVTATYLNDQEAAVLLDLWEKTGL